MGKRLTEAPITTRNARAQLPSGVHWRGIDPDVHLGYRRGSRGGSWLVRWRAGKGYKQNPLGTADDALEADGDNALTFSQALSAARKHVESERARAALEAAGPVLTIKIAIDQYVSERDARVQGRAGRSSRKSDGHSRLFRHVLSDAHLSNCPLAFLTEGKIMDWRNAFPATLSPSSKQRTMSDFRAALNRAARVHRDKLPAHITVIIKNAFVADSIVAPAAREAQILADADVRRIIAAAADVDREGDWDGDLTRLIIVLAATGARFSQVSRISVSDVQPAQRRVMVPTSRKGRGTKRTAKTAVRVGDDVLTALRPAIAGRKGTDALLIRPRWKQLSPTVWTKVSRESWSSASEITRPWSKIIAKAELPADIVPYALRHSSIVRGLGAGLPVRLVAALHDTSSAMIEKHYAAYIVDAMDELAARAIVPLTGADIVPLSHAPAREVAQ